MARVIISVPHAFCRTEDDKIKHVCDVVAERVARKLFDLLTDKGHKVMLRIADVSRMDVDYNRSESRGSAWRKALAEDFKRADYLCDVHSYSGQNTHWGEDVVILKWLDENGGDNRKYVNDLLYRLAALDLDVATSYPKNENDIVCHALECGVPATLLEFSEKSIANNEKRVIPKVAEALDGFLKTLQNHVEESKIPLLLERMVNSDNAVNSEIDKLIQAMEEQRLVEIRYAPVGGIGAVTRIVEPYSFRKTPYGTLFYGWDIYERKTKSFYTDNIIRVVIQPRTFRPKWEVEPDSIFESVDRENQFPFAEAVLEDGFIIDSLIGDLLQS